MREAFVVGHLVLGEEGLVRLKDVTVHSEPAMSLTMTAAAVNTARVDILSAQAREYSDAIVLCMREADERARLLGTAWKAIALLLRQYVAQWSPDIYRQYRGE